MFCHDTLATDLCNAEFSPLCCCLGYGPNLSPAWLSEGLFKVIHTSFRLHLHEHNTFTASAYQKVFFFCFCGSNWWLCMWKENTTDVFLYNSPYLAIILALLIFSEYISVFSLSSNSPEKSILYIFCLHHSSESFAGTCSPENQPSVMSQKATL